MTSTSAQEPTAAAALETLRTLPRAAARALAAAMQDAGLPSYLRFLEIMYHYTAGTREKIARIVQSAHTEELVVLFSRMQREEEKHYLLAKADLAAFGKTVGSQVPEPVRNFDAAFRELGRQGCHGYLGAAFVFENIAREPELSAAALGYFGRLKLQKHQMTWARVHLAADREHGAAVEKVCLRYLPENPAAMLRGAQVASRAWIEVFTAAFRAEQAV